MNLRQDINEQLDNKSNSFEQVMLSLTVNNSVDNGEDNAVDIFSKSCLETFNAFNWDGFGYPFTQVFEENVLREVITLKSIQSDTFQAQNEHFLYGNINDIWMRSQSKDLTTNNLINYSACLASVSRFKCSAIILDNLAQRKLSNRQGFESAWIKYVISNRTQQGLNSDIYFSMMREAITAGGIPLHRMVDIATQAVVWYQKRKEISTSNYDWYLNLGCQLVAKKPDISPDTLSSWYRGIAMIPATSGDISQTRKTMNFALEKANEVCHKSTSFSSQNLIKTYYESAIKESLYVRRDISSAIENAEKLIALDPHWSISYGELADVYFKANDNVNAAKYYELASRKGPPYFSFHLLQAARCYKKINKHDEAARLYSLLTRIVPQNQQILQEYKALCDDE